MQGYLDMVDREVHICKHTRYGQSLFNILYDLDRDAANMIRATDIDPFYCKHKTDIKVKNFLSHIEQHFPIITH